MAEGRADVGDITSHQQQNGRAWYRLAVSLHGTGAEDQARMIHFYGELEGGVMDYWTDEIPQKDGTKLKRHLQFIPSGKDQVRQFSQGSTDGGKTWKVEYDFIYNRKK